MLSERNPVLLWQCLAELVREIPDFKDYLQLKLIGTVSDDVIQTINSYDLADFVDQVGYVSHREALIQQRRSQILILIEIYF
jgi:hypothetical protein